MGGSRTGIAYLIRDKYKDEYEAVFGAMPTLPDTVATAMPGTPEWDALADEERDAINEVYVNFGKAIGAYEALM